MSMKAQGLLFGLNYKHCKSNQLNGCVNDVNNMSIGHGASVQDTSGDEMDLKDEALVPSDYEK
eukprot:762606-Hanusia_phi.AAC.1